MYGTPGENPLTAELLDHHRIRFTADGVAIGRTTFTVPAPVLVAALPSPWTPGAAVVVYTAPDPDHAHGLNALFHGPATLTLGRRTAGGPEVVGQLELLLDPEGRVEAVDAAPGTVTAAQAVEDLHALDALLRTTYSGFPELRPEGGWDAHAARTEGRLRSREAWTWTEVVDVLVREHLAPVRDTHFAARGTGIVDGVPVSVDARLVVPRVPWFTELRVGTDGVVTRGPGALVGRSLDGVPAVPGPREVVPGTPYLFPTIGADGAPAFLVGVFVAGADVAPDLDLLGASLPLHRTRSRRTDRGTTWELVEGDVPALAVRTMAESALEGLADTARTLRAGDRLVLDLRANGGGSDRPAHAWVTGFSPGAYHLAGAADVDDGAWTCFVPRTISQPGEPWSGSLHVLVDRGVASAGETFALVARQVPGAVLVGESTAGCTENGNVTERGPLPHTRLRFAWGHTRFVWDAVRPVAEGVGVFPDLWLDVADPVGFLAAQPR